MLRIRIAQETDIENLLPLLDALFTQESEFQPNAELQRAGLRAIITDASVGKILVAEDSGQMIGMVNLLYTVSTALGGRVALLEDMVVMDIERGQGIGAQLLKAAISTCREDGCKRITLLTDESNRGAHRFYTRHGFQQSNMVAFRQMLDE